MYLFKSIVPLFHDQSIYNSNFILYKPHVNDKVNELEKEEAEMRKLLAISF